MFVERRNKVNGWNVWRKEAVVMNKPIGEVKRKWREWKRIEGYVKGCGERNNSKKEVGEKTEKVEKKKVRYFLL